MRKAGDRLRKELVPSNAPMNHGGKGGTKGTFTAEAHKHGMSTQAFASKVKAHPDDYSPAMRKKANFAHNANKWSKG